MAARNILHKFYNGDQYDHRFSNRFVNKCHAVEVRSHIKIKKTPSGKLRHLRIAEIKLLKFLEQAIYGVAIGVLIPGEIAFKTYKKHPIRLPKFHIPKVNFDKLVNQFKKLFPEKVENIKEEEPPHTFNFDIKPGPQPGPEPSIKDIDERNRVIRAQIKEELEDFSKKLTELGVSNSQAMIENLRVDVFKFIRSEELFLSRPLKEVLELTDRAASVYASSYVHYSELVLFWAKSTLDTAIAKGAQGGPYKVVYMERDGTPALEAAKVLKEAFPDKYGQVEIKSLPVSRKLVSWAEENDDNRKMYREFILQEGIFNEEEENHCLFVDIGFQGSKIEFLREFFAEFVEKIEFEFLISHNPEVKGYLADTDALLSSIPASGKNTAVYWLEDTHQGTKNSPISLYRDPKTSQVKLYNFLDKKYSTCRQTKPESYLYKHFGSLAIRDGIKAHLEFSMDSIRQSEIREWSMASKELREKTDDFLRKIVRSQHLNIVDNF